MRQNFKRFFREIYGTPNDQDPQHQYIRDGFFGNPLGFKPFNLAHALAERWVKSRDNDSTPTFIAKQLFYVPALAITAALGLAYMPLKLFVLTPVKAISSLVRLVTEAPLRLLENGTKRLFGNTIAKIFQIPRLIIRATLAPSISAQFAVQADKENAAEKNGNGFIQSIKGNKYKILSTMTTIIGLACISAGFAPLMLAIIGGGGGGVISTAIGAIAKAVKSNYLAHVLFGTAIKTTVGGTVGLGKKICDHVREQQISKALSDNKEREVFPQQYTNNRSKQIKALEDTPGARAARILEAVLEKPSQLTSNSKANAYQEGSVANTGIFSHCRFAVENKHKNYGLQGHLLDTSRTAKR